MRTGMLVGVAGVVVFAFQCKRPNSAYCDDARPCPQGLSCDLVARECSPVVGGGSVDMKLDIDMAGCTCSDTTPICIAMTCNSCLSTSDPDAACAAASPSTPFCERSGDRAGACVACRDSTDCSGTTPFCDAATHSCRGCVADAECASYVCDLTPGSMVPRQCVPMNQVEYVDGSATMNGNGLSPTTPRQKIQDAVNHATGGDNRAYVRVAPGSYNESVGVSNGATIYVVGANGATISPTNGDAVGASTGGILVVRNIIAIAPGGNAANCQNSHLTAYRSQFLNSSQSGVYSLNCTLIVDASWIDGNGDGGLYIGGGNFHVLNSIITRNRNFGGLYQAAAGTDLLFDNNTVADNTASGSYAGVACATGSLLNIHNTIFFNNKNGGAAIAETNCTSAFAASDGVSAGVTVDLTATAPGFIGGTPVTAASYHLQAASPCVNRASSSYASDHDFDFEVRPDHASMLPDIGADEFQP